MLLADTYSTAQELIRMGMSEQNAKALAYAVVADGNVATKQELTLDCMDNLFDNKLTYKELIA